MGLFWAGGCGSPFSTGSDSSGDDAPGGQGGDRNPDASGGTTGATGGGGGEVTCTSVAQCDDGDPCTQDSCSPQGICEWTQAASLCDDGDSCTLIDACSDGVCVGLTEHTCPEFSECRGEGSEPTCACIEGFTSCTPPSGGSSVCIREGTCCTDDDCASSSASCPAPGGGCDCTAQNPVDCDGTCFPVCCPGEAAGKCGLNGCGTLTCNGTGSGYSCSGEFIAFCSDAPPLCPQGSRAECHCEECSSDTCKWRDCFP